MSEKIKGMFGSETRADEVIEWLKSQGAENHALNEIAEDDIYFVYQGRAMTVYKNLSFLFDIVELPRWRAEEKAWYYYASDSGYARCSRELGDDVDEDRYKLGNYFKTKEEADLYAEKIREIFKERRE